MLWSPPRVRSLVRGNEGCERAGGRLPSSEKAALICFRANSLSNGVMGMSPQSSIVKGEVYGFRPRRGLKPRKAVCREEAALMARGPKRAPVERRMIRVWSCRRRKMHGQEDRDNSGIMAENSHYAGHHSPGNFEREGGDLG